MRMVWWILIILAVAFAAGGGGGGGSGGSSTGDVNYEVTTTFSCTTGVLTVKTTLGASPIGDMSVQLKKDGGVAQKQFTNTAGEAGFTAGSGAYTIATQRNGYAYKETIISIDPCAPSTPSSETPVPDAVDDAPLCKEATQLERIRCRLDLKKEYVQDVRYTPEECWGMDTSARQSCIQRYRLFQTCRTLETDEGRAACIRPKLGLNGTLEAILADCRTRFGTSRALCVQQVKEAVFNLVKFRMYNLEYKTEEFLDAGMNRTEGEVILVKIAQAKIAFDQAITMDQRRAAIRQLQQDWEAFTQKAKAQGMRQERIVE